VSDTPELDVLLGPDVWLRGASGATVHRDELISRIERELLAVDDDEEAPKLAALVSDLQADTRKSISRKKIIEMIEGYIEWMPRRPSG
jgi:hypothetical protein